MFTDFCCEENPGISPRQLLDVTQQWIIDQFSLLRTFTIDSLLHTTNLVSEEYKPEGGKLGEKGLPTIIIRNMATVIRGHLNETITNNEVLGSLRVLPNVDKRLANPAIGLSDEDLSLVQLGLELTSNGHPVVLLTNDQDLLQFVTWARIQVSLRTPPYNPQLLEGWSCLAYLELIHRTCRITSDQMGQMIRFAIRDTAKRAFENGDMALNPRKGMRIIDQTISIEKMFVQSVEIKNQNQAATL